MQFKSFTVIVSFFLGVFAFCPPENELLPLCYCDEPHLICGKTFSAPEEFDIKGYFDRISTLVPEDTVFDWIRLHNIQHKEIPAETFKTIKFRNIIQSQFGIDS